MDLSLLNLNTVQGKFINQSFGLSKHSHNAQLLEAMSIKSVTDTVVRNCSVTATVMFYF